MENLNITSPSFFYSIIYELKDLAAYSSFTHISNSSDHKRYYVQVEDAKLSIIQRIKNLAASIFYILKWEIGKSLLRQAISGKMELCFSTNSGDLKTLFEGKWLFSREHDPLQSNAIIQKIVSSQLKSLDLRNNELTAIPESISKLASLQTLDLDNNRLTAIPESISKLTSLRSLRLNNNRLTAIPESISKLTSLQHLNLRYNQLTAIPESISKLASLQSLDLDNNRLTAIPESISKLASLQSLDLDNNRLTAIPESISKLASLQSLYLIDNQLTAIPESISNLTNLQHLNLRYNQLTAIPEFISKLTSLQDLDLGNNELTAIPESISNLTSLQDLDLEHNELTAIPESISNLTSLQYLNLRYNQLTAIPESISNLTSLQSLHLNNNRLTAIPESISNLTSLQSLYLSGNQLTAIPESISNLTNLQHLNLRYNQLTAIPACLYTLSHNCEVYLEGNLLTQEVIEELQNHINQPGYRGPRFIFSAEGLERNRNQTFIPLSESLKKWGGKNHPLNFSTWSEKDKNNLSHWLARLEKISDYEKCQIEMIEKVQELLVWLQEETDASIITNVKAILTDATSTCGDRVARSVNEIWLQRQIAKSPSLSIIGLKDLIIGINRYELLQKIAEEKCKSLNAVDPIEVHLCYETRLREDLNLPLETKEMLYERLASVTNEDIVNAKNKILGETSTIEQQIKILIENPSWKNKLNSERDFVKIKYDCEEAKSSVLEKIEPEEQVAYHDQYQANEKTIWDPYYVFTKKLLQKDDSKMEENF